ncbi:MAG: helix-turn-helix transcriptional regulator [Hyphomicrobiales bacterium]|nr:helix-turn-helix transcriptional regulator [Hyphomicrobiales bacterium]
MTAKRKAIAPRQLPRRVFFREWRKYRGLTQEQAAERMGILQGTLSKTERGEIRYTQDFLESASAAYGCDQGALLSINPLVDDPLQHAIADLRQAPPELQRRAANVISALLKDS